MASVNEAYEVLLDSDPRARFDTGEDPVDPVPVVGLLHTAEAQVAVLVVVIHLRSSLVVVERVERVMDV